MLKVPLYATRTFWMSDKSSWAGAGTHVVASGSAQHKSGEGRVRCPVSSSFSSVSLRDFQKAIDLAGAPAPHDS